jgi:hypothetical protein
VNVEVNSLHVKRIAIEDLVGYVYIVRVDVSRSSSRPKSRDKGIASERRKGSN